ncbi:CLUMA_CG010469, isoform A [Clunio marinus]|uniref:CLUMA_CG010469, isoform A n=1 Tax=Clunio marinus TaxID=568069 RepID=A0A1J1IDJ1_9DIPT|nr:CLUMA_CG010469, isoform A [Clunio marinus]
MLPYFFGERKKSPKHSHRFYDDGLLVNLNKLDFLPFPCECGSIENFTNLLNSQRLGLQLPALLRVHPSGFCDISSYKEFCIPRSFYLHFTNTFIQQLLVRLDE